MTIRSRCSSLEKLQVLLLLRCLLTSLTVGTLQSVLVPTSSVEVVLSLKLIS